MKKLDLYYIDLKYIRNLSHVDDNVMSISPQRGKQNRPFVGVVVLMNIVLIYSLHYSVFRITQLYTASYCICLLLHSPTFSHTFLISRYFSQGLTLLSIKFYQMLFSILNYSEFMINWVIPKTMLSRNQSKYAVFKPFLFWKFGITFHVCLRNDYLKEAPDQIIRDNFLMVLTRS